MVYDAYGIMASISIYPISLKPSWNASEKNWKVCKKMKLKYTQLATPQLQNYKRWTNVDVLANDVLQKTFAKAAAIVLS